MFIFYNLRFYQDLRSELSLVRGVHPAMVVVPTQVIDLVNVEAGALILDDLAHPHWDFLVTILSNHEIPNFFSINIKRGVFGDIFYHVIKEHPCCIVWIPRLADSSFAFEQLRDEVVVEYVGERAIPEFLHQACNNHIPDVLIVRVSKALRQIQTLLVFNVLHEVISSVGSSKGVGEASVGRPSEDIVGGSKLLDMLQPLEDWVV